MTYLIANVSFQVRASMNQSISLQDIVVSTFVKKGRHSWWMFIVEITLSQFDLRCSNSLVFSSGDARTRLSGASSFLSYFILRHIKDSDIKCCTRKAFLLKRIAVVEEHGFMWVFKPTWSNCVLWLSPVGTLNFVTTWNLRFSSMLSAYATLRSYVQRCSYTSKRTVLIQQQILSVKCLPTLFC